MLDQLSPRPGRAASSRKRVGRGPGSGRGKTCGTGTRARTRSGARPRWFEGGQMPLQHAGAQARLHQPLPQRTSKS